MSECIIVVKASSFFLYSLLGQGGGWVWRVKGGVDRFEWKRTSTASSLSESLRKMEYASTSPSPSVGILLTGIHIEHLKPECRCILELKADVW